MNLRSELPTAENSTNFNIVPESTTTVGTTLENLKAAIAGETGASAKYAAASAAAACPKPTGSTFSSSPSRNFRCRTPPRISNPTDRIPSV